MTPRKTAKEISDAIITQLESSLNTVIPLLPKSFIRTVAKALGGVFVLLYQYAGFILLQLFVKTASNKPMTVGGITITPLAMWGALVDIYQKLGQQAEYTVSITVITQTGVIQSGERIVNPATEMIYVVVGDVALDAPEVYASIRATEVGELGNVDVGTTLQFVSPPSTVEKAVEVTAELADGVDEEDTEPFRQRVLERYAARPQGGAYADYRDWAQEVVGVKRAFPYSGWQLDPHPESPAPYEGSGEVFVFIESEADPDGVPDPLAGSTGRPPGGALLTEVFDYLEANEAGLANRRNICAYIRVYPIRPRTWSWTTGGRTVFDIEVFGLTAVEDVETTKTAIEEALADYFDTREPYITGLAIPPRKDVITKMTVGGVVGQVAAAYGGAVLDVEMEAEGSVETIWYLQEGEMVKLGTVTWS